MELPGILKKVIFSYTDTQPTKVFLEDDLELPK